MENGPDPKRKLVTSLINHYEPDAVVDDAYYESISKKHPNTDTLVSKLITHYEPDSEVTTEYLSGLYSKYGVTEKKNVVGASQPSLFPGLGGSSNGNVPSPLSASATPPKKTFGEGALEAVRTPEPKNKTLDNIYEKYPAFKGLGEVTIKADRNFTREKTGAGSIEYFSPKQDTVRYETGLNTAHPKLGTHGILYNPDTNTEEDIMLDMLHGMASVPAYAKLRNEFKQQALKDRGGDIKYFYEQDKKEGRTDDGYESWLNNYVDGLIRSEVSTQTEGDYATERKGNTPAMKGKASAIKKYLSNGREIPAKPIEGLGKQEAVSYGDKLAEDIVEGAMNRPYELAKTAQQQIDSGDYVVNGKKVTEYELRSKLLDRGFVAEVNSQLREGTFQSSGILKLGKNASPETVALANHQIKSQGEFDEFKSLQSGLMGLNIGLTNMPNYLNLMMEQATGIPNAFFTTFMSVSPEMKQMAISGEAKDRLTKYVANLNKIKEGYSESKFKTEDPRAEKQSDFVDLFNQGKYGEMGRTIVNSTLESAPIMIGAAATAAMTGNPMTGAAFLVPQSASTRLADIQNSKDIKVKGLTPSERLADVNISGMAEGIPEALMGPVVNKSFKLFKQGVQQGIKRIFEQGGKDAAIDAAEGAAKETAAKLIKNYGNELALGYGEEAATSTITEFKDVYLGTSDKTILEIIRTINNDGMIGSLSQGLISTPGTGIALANKAALNGRRLFDKKVSTPEGQEDLKEFSKQYAQKNGQNEQEVLASIEARIKAVNAVPKRLIDDTKTIDLVQEKQDLTEQMRNLDDAFKKPLADRIAKIEEEIAYRAERNEFIKKREALVGEIDGITDAPDGIKKAYQDFEEGKEVPLQDLQKASDWAYSELKRMRAMKGSSTSELSQERVDDYIDLLTRDVSAFEDKISELKNAEAEFLTEPVINSTPTDEKYASVNNNDGKGTVDLTKQEYLDWKAKKNTTTEQLTISKTKERIQEIESLLSSDNASMQKTGSGNLIKEAREKLILELAELKKNAPTADVVQPQGKEDAKKADYTKRIERKLTNASEEKNPIKKALILYDALDSATRVDTGQKESVQELLNAHLTESGLKIENVEIGSKYNDTNTSLEATISGEGIENLKVIEVLSPIIRDANGIIVKQGKVIVESSDNKKTEQNAKEQQSGQMREQGVQEQPQGESDSNMPIVNQAELQDGKAPKEEVVGAVDVDWSKDIENVDLSKVDWKSPTTEESIAGHEFNIQNNVKKGQQSLLPAIRELAKKYNLTKEQYLNVLPNIRQVLSNKEPDINSIENIISREGKVEQSLKETPQAGSVGVGKPSSERTELYSVPILLDPKAKVRGDKQEYITREVFDRAFEKDDREGINFQTAETLIRRGGYSTEELNKLLPNWRELLPKEQSLKKTPQAEPTKESPKEPVSESELNKGGNIEARRNALPDSQVNTRTKATQSVLDYFAEVIGIPKFTEDLSKGTYISWLRNTNNLGESLTLLLEQPKRAFDEITKYGIEIAALENKAKPKEPTKEAPKKPVSESELNKKAPVLSDSEKSSLKKFLKFIEQRQGERTYQNMNVQKFKDAYNALPQSVKDFISSDMKGKVRAYEGDLSDSETPSFSNQFIPQLFGTSKVYGEEIETNEGIIDTGKLSELADKNKVSNNVGTDEGEVIVISPKFKKGAENRRGALRDFEQIILDLDESLGDDNVRNKEIRKKQRELKDLLNDRKFYNEIAKSDNVQEVLDKYNIKTSIDNKPFVESFGTPVEDLNDVSEGVMQTNLDGVDVLFSEVDGNTVKLESIETPEGEREQGKAKKALQKIIDKADELGKTIVLSVVPKDETLGSKLLPIKEIKKMQPEQVVLDIKRRPLIHAGGIGMESTEAIGTYISTDVMGNSYAKNAKKLYKADVNISNPFIGTNLIAMSHTKDRIQKAIDIMFKEGTLSESQMDKTSRFMTNLIRKEIDDNTTYREYLSKVSAIDDEKLTAASPTRLSEIVAELFTEELKSKGYDSIYHPEGENREGYLVVFDKENVTLTEIKNQKEVVENAPINQPKTTEEGLRKLYEGFGFVATEGKNMERVPNAEVKETKAEVTPEVKEVAATERTATREELQKELYKLFDKKDATDVFDVEDMQAVDKEIERVSALLEALPKEEAQIAPEQEFTDEEIAIAYAERQDALKEIDSKEYKSRQIHNMFTKIPLHEYLAMGDRKYYKGSEKFFRNLVDKDAPSTQNSIEDMANEMSEAAGIEITEGDIIKYIEDIVADRIKGEDSFGAKELKSKKGAPKKGRKAPTVSRKEKLLAERKALIDKIKSGLNEQGFAFNPKNAANDSKILLNDLVKWAQIEIELGAITAKEFIEMVIKEKGYDWRGPARRAYTIGLQTMPDVPFKDVKEKVRLLEKAALAEITSAMKKGKREGIKEGKANKEAAIKEVKEKLRTSFKEKITSIKEGFNEYTNEKKAEAKSEEDKARLGGEIRGKAEGRKEGIKEGKKEGKQEGLEKGFEKAKDKYVNIGYRLGEAYGKLGGEIRGKAEGRKEGIKEEAARGKIAIAQKEREVKKGLIQRQKDFANDLNNILQDMISQARLENPDIVITPKQLKAITNKLLSVSPFLPKSFDRAIDYMAKALDDAAYLDNMDKVRDAQKAVKKRKHPAFQSAVNQFLSIKPEMIPDALVEPYMKALKDMDARVPSYRAMQDMFFDIMQNIPNKKPEYDAATELTSAETLFDKILEASETISNIGDYMKLLKDIQKWRAKANRILTMEDDPKLNDAYETLVDRIDAIQEQYETKYKDAIADMKAIRVDHILSRIKELDPYKNPSGYNDLNLSEEAKTVLKQLSDIGIDGINQMTFEEVTTLGDILDLVQQDGYTDLSRLAPILSSAIARQNAEKIAPQVEKANDIENIKKLQSDLSRVDSAFREGVMGLGRAKYGAFYNRLIAPMQRASAKHFNFVNSGRKVFNNKKKELNLNEKNMDRIGMVMFYLREHALSFDPKFQDKSDEKNGKYGFRDWFHDILQNNKANYGISNADNLKRKAGIEFIGNKNKYFRMKDAFDSLPKNAEGKVDVKAVYESFKNGSNEYLSKKEMTFLKDILEWESNNIVGKQRAANEMRGKPFDEIMFHILRKRTPKLRSIEVEPAQTVLTDKNRVKLASDSGKAITSEKIEPIEFNFEELFDVNLNEVSRDYFYTPALMEFNKTVNEVKKRISDSKKTIMDVAAWDMQESLAHELTFGSSNKTVRNILGAQAMQVFINPIRTAVELASSLSSYPLRARITYANAVNSMFADTKMVQDLLTFTSSPLMNRENLQKHFELERGQIKEKGLFTRLTHAMAGAPERVLLKPIWYGRFQVEFFNRTGERFSPTEYANPRYKEKYRQEILDAASAADAEYQKIAGSATGIGTRRTAKILPDVVGKALGLKKGGDIDVKSNAGLLFTFMTGYQSRELEQVIEGLKSIKDISKEQGVLSKDNAWAVGILGGAVIGTLTYTYLSQMNYIMQRLLLPGDDEDEEEIKKELKSLSQFDGKQIATSLTSLSATRYNGLGRQLLKALGSVWYNMTDDEAKKKEIKTLIRNFTFQNPYDIDRYGSDKGNMAESMSEAIPVASIVINNFAKATRNYKDVKKALQKVEDGTPLSEMDRENLLMMKFMVSMINATGQFAGANIPTTTMDRAINNYVAENKPEAEVMVEAREKAINKKKQELLSNIKTKNDFITNTDVMNLSAVRKDMNDLKLGDFTLKEIKEIRSQVKLEHTIQVFEKKAEAIEGLSEIALSANKKKFNNGETIAKNYILAHPKDVKIEPKTLELLGKVLSVQEKRDLTSTFTKLKATNK